MPSAHWSPTRLVAHHARDIRKAIPGRTLDKATKELAPYLPSPWANRATLGLLEAQRQENPKRTKPIDIDLLCALSFAYWASPLAFLTPPHEPDFRLAVGEKLLTGEDLVDLLFRDEKYVSLSLMALVTLDGDDPSTAVREVPFLDRPGIPQFSLMDEAFLARFRQDQRVTDLTSSGVSREWSPSTLVGYYAWEIRRKRELTLVQAARQLRRYLVRPATAKERLNAIEQRRLPDKTHPRIFVDDLFALALAYDVSPIAFLIPPTPHVTLIVGWEFIEADEVASLFYSTIDEIRETLVTKHYRERSTGEPELIRLHVPGYPPFVFGSDDTAPSE